MEFTTVSVWVMSVVFVAAMVRSTFGFGDALVGMPLLVILVDLKTATPLMAFVAVLVSILLLIRTWRKIQFRAYWPLVISAIVGIPLGLVFLRESHEVVMKIVISLIELNAPWTCRSSRFHTSFPEDHT